MATGRKAAQASLKPLLVNAGWRPRAAGWFTKVIEPGYLGVIAVGAASQGMPAGTADVTLYVGLRSEEIESIVEYVCGVETPKYQGRTWVIPLGYLLPEASWKAGEREIAQANVQDVAKALVRLTVQHAEPRLREVALDPNELAQLAEASIGSMGSHGLCRIAALKGQTQSTAVAADYVRQRIDALADRTDAAAEAEREVAPRLLSILGTG